MYPKCKKKLKNTRKYLMLNCELYFYYDLKTVYNIKSEL